jgi:RNA polymerase sigma factor (TIGR02999 family)
VVSDITGLLTSANRGDEGARGQLFAEFYPELRRLAHARMQGHRLATLLGTTALVHESYLRVLKSGRIQITDRAHFMAYSGRVMRSVIIDRLRARRARRRDATGPLDVDAVGPASGEAEILRVHEALEDLATMSQRLASIVEMRYFAGLTECEIAEALGITERTVRRDWQKARLILAAALNR